MTEKYREEPYPSLRTVDDLVNILQNNPPLLFANTTAPVLDRRDFEEPLFTVEAMGKRLYEIAKDGLYERTSADDFTLHFGLRQERRNEFFKDGVIIGKDIVYEGPHEETGFSPVRTLGLYGLAPVDYGLATVGIELTRYLNPPNESVDVYKLLENTEAIEGNILIELPRVFTRSQIIIGAPDWRREYRYKLAENFGFVQRRTKIFPT